MAVVHQPLINAVSSDFREGHKYGLRQGSDWLVNVHGSLNKPCRFGIALRTYS
jgi:hypothetical protein